MSTRNIVRAVLFCVALQLPSLHAADEWHFVVENASESRITKLQVSQDGEEGGYFEIGRGIGVGETATLTWDASTNDEACVQWIRAEFSDGSYSEPSQQDFCEDLDTPIVFSE
jgi:hypothetical protein